jgi:8-oxo-dGTP diphosphatase
MEPKQERPSLANSVAGIAVKDKRVLIAKRKAGGDLGGKWEFPGGKVEPGEGDKDALIREYLEELAVPVEVGSFIDQAAFQHGETHFTLRAYAIKLLSEDFSSREHSEYRWAGAGELDGLDFAESDRLLFPKVKSLLGAL